MKAPTDTVYEMFGVPIACLDRREAVSVADRLVSAGGDRTVLFGVVNAAKLVRMRGDPALFRAVLASDIILADGMSVVWASRLLGKAIPERVTGIDLMQALLEQASSRGWRVYFLGATEYALSKALDAVRRDYPGAVICGAHHGYFSEKDEKAIVADIRDSRPDLLFVGMGSPKKERFLAKYADDCGAIVCHGVGGSLDVMAGLVRRAPRRWQAMGLEWLWRVMQEPRRLWRRYLVTNTLFSLMVAEALLARLLPANLRGVDDVRWGVEPDSHRRASSGDGTVAGLEDRQQSRSFRSSGDR